MPDELLAIKRFRDQRGTLFAVGFPPECPDPTGESRDQQGIGVRSAMVWTLAAAPELAAMAINRTAPTTPRIRIGMVNSFGTLMRGSPLPKERCQRQKSCTYASIFFVCLDQTESSRWWSLRLAR